MRRWLYKDDEAKIFHDDDIHEAIEDGWGRRPETKVIHESLDTLSDEELVEIAKDRGFKGATRMNRSTLLKKLKDK